MSAKNIEAVYPLSPLQEGMLFHTLESEQTDVYLIQYTCTLEGEVEPEDLRRSWLAAAKRHDVLRTFFTWEKRDRPLQVVRERIELPFEVSDWRGLPLDGQTERWNGLVSQDRAVRFDLTRAPLARIHLARFDQDEWRMLWTVHHLLMDGWSGRLLLREVFEGCAAPEEPRTGFRYRDFIAWLEAREGTGDRRFWETRVGDFETVTNVSLGAPRSAGADSPATHDSREALAPVELTAALRDAARGLRVTLHTLLLGSWAYLLHRYSGQFDIVFGTTVTTRPPGLPGVEDAVGLYMNTIPLRVPIDSKHSVGDWLRAIQTEHAEAREHGFAGLSEIQRLSGVPRGEALFTTLVSFESFPDHVVKANHPLPFEVTNESLIEHSNYPLALLVVPEEQLRLLVVFDKSKFDGQSVERLLGHLLTILRAFSLDSHRALADTPLLEPGERSRLVEALSRSDLEPPEVQDVVEAFEQRARETPDSIAVHGDRESLTYDELNRRANQLGRLLGSRGVRREGLVALVADRSVSTIVAMLATLKAGGAYVPIDPRWPAERVQSILEDLSDPLVVCESDSSNLPESAAVLTLDSAPEQIAAEDSGNLNETFSLAQAAYVIYTSGSTGVPKGVVVERGALAASNSARHRYYRHPVSCFLLMSPLSVDSSVAGIYWTLSSGGTLLLPRERAEQDVTALGQSIRDQRVSHTLLLPSLWRLILESAATEQLESLRCVVVAGEACAVETVRLHRGTTPRTELHNEYGPCEGTVWATVADLLAQDAGQVTIGRPIPGARVYIVDGRLRPVPLGAPGEICVGGASVARGYLHRDDLTAERFVMNPFHEGRLYRTGDRGRFLDDGRIEFLGRVDRQVKVAGHRVELAEVERALERHRDVREAAAAWRGDPPRIEAYVVPAPGADALPDDIRTALGRSLPSYMLPNQVTVLGGLPRTPAGKLDYAALPEPVNEEPADAVVGPSDEIEEALAAIWKDSLGLEEISVRDDFFELGGDSPLSIRLLSRVAKQNLSVNPETFFQDPTILGMAAAIRSPKPAAEQDLVVGECPLTPIQHWFFDNIRVGQDHWNDSAVLKLPSDADFERTLEVVDALWKHHDALRTRLSRSSGGLKAYFDDPPPPAVVALIDLRGAPPELTAAALGDAAAKLHRSLDLFEGPLTRFAFVDFAPNDRRLLIVAHHLVVDHLSWGIIREDLGALLRSERLTAKTASFKNCAERLTAAAGEIARRDESYWLAQAPGIEDPPADFSPRSEAALFKSVDNVSTALTPVDTDRLLELAETADGLESNAPFLAALVECWHEWTGGSVLHVDLEGHGRDTLPLDASRTVGWFTTVFPVVLTRVEGPRTSQLAKVKEQLTAVPAKGAGHGVARYLLPDAESSKELGRMRRPPVLFNYLGRREGDFLRAFGCERSPRGNLAYVLEINAYVSQGRLHFNWMFSADVYRRETIERLAASFEAHLDEISRASEGDGQVARASQGDNGLLASSGLSKADLSRVAALLDESDNE